MSLFREKKVAPIREADAYIHSVRTKRRRRKKIIIGALVCLGLGLLSIGFVWIIIYAPLFQIKTLEISGNIETKSDLIESYLNAKISTASIVNTVLGSGNMISWKEGVFQDFISELPRLKTISVEKEYFNRKIKINIEERSQFGIWCGMKKGLEGEDTGFIVNSVPYSVSCYWFDREGILLEPAPHASGNLIPVVHDYSDRALRSQLKVHGTQSIANLISVFEVINEFGFSVAEVKIANRDLEEVEVYLRNGPKLLFSLRFPADDAVSVIKSLMSSGGNGKSFVNLDYVDFRVERRAYFK